VWVQRDEGDNWGGSRDQKGLCGNDAVVLSMGLVASLHKGLLPRGRDFLILITTHALIVRYMCCKYAYCAIHIFLLCSLKINHMTEIPNKRLFLGPLAWLHTLLMSFFIQRSFGV
jgi:hypothetical protein